MKIPASQLNVITARIIFTGYNISYQKPELDAGLLF